MPVFKGAAKSSGRSCPGASRTPRDEGQLFPKPCPGSCHLLPTQQPPLSGVHRAGDAKTQIATSSACVSSAWQFQTHLKIMGASSSSRGLDGSHCLSAAFPELDIACHAASSSHCPGGTRVGASRRENQSSEHSGAGQAPKILPTPTRNPGQGQISHQQCHQG